MKPGIELDRIIAERILEWNVRGFPPGRGQDTRKSRNPPYVVEAEDIPAYSKDIKAAWEVVEKLKSQSIYASVAANLFGYKVDVNVQPGVKFEAASEFAPHAICLAALRTIGVF